MARYTLLLYGVEIDRRARPNHLYRTVFFGRAESGAGKGGTMHHETISEISIGKRRNWVTTA